MNAEDLLDILTEKLETRYECKSCYGTGNLNHEFDDKPYRQCTNCDGDGEIVPGDVRSFIEALEDARNKTRLY